MSIRHDQSDQAAPRAAFPWVPLIAAAGVAAAAFLIFSKAKAEDIQQQADDLLEFCERAASALDQRLIPSDVALAG